MSLATLANFKLILGITTSTQNTLLQLYLDAADAAVRSYLQRGKNRAAFTSWPESGSDTMYLDGTGRQELVLPFRPVTAIASIYLDLGANYGTTSGAFGSSTLLTEATDYVMVRDDGATTSSSGIVRRLGGSTTASGNFWGWDPNDTVGLGPLPSLTAGRGGPFWPRIPGSIKITYTAGFATVPTDLSMAALAIASYIRRTAPLGGVPLSSESLRDYSYSLGTSGAIGQMPELGSARMLLAKYRSITVA